MSDDIDDLLGRAGLTTPSPDTVEGFRAGCGLFQQDIARLTAEVERLKAEKTEAQRVIVAMLEGFRTVKNIAFEMKAPNSYTPRFVHVALTAEALTPSDMQGMVVVPEEPIAWLRDVDGTGSLHPCAEGDAGAIPVFARPR